jgi:four helix bundle protein
MMATAERFEDLRCWQTGRQLTNLVYAYSEDGAFSDDFSLKDQIRRASVSIMSNVAEGFNSRTTGQFVNLLGRARGSASEVQAQLYAALDRGYISQEQFEEAYDLADKVSRQIYRFTRYLKSQSEEGSVREPTVSYDISDEHVE